MSGSERRRYFRVSDNVAIRYKVVGEDERIGQQSLVEEDSLTMLENKISAALEPLRSSNPHLLEVLNLFNQKINLFSQNNEELGASLKGPQQLVNLSACGIAFPVNEQLDLNQQILLDLTLYPSNIPLRLAASVIGCEVDASNNAEAGYLLRADFLDLSVADQEVLVQHVMRCQNTQLRRAREARG